MGFYERVLRPAMFCLPAETAHNLGKRALSMEFLWRPQAERRRVTDPRLEIKVAGLRQTSPFGLTAGFDKDALALPGLARLGFGSITVGTIMPKPRAGNPRPRLGRRPQEGALVNCLGLPSRGLDYAVRNLRRYRASHPAAGPPVIANVGGFTIDEVLGCFRSVEPFVDAVELDLICPNVRMEGDLARLEGIVKAMKTAVAERTKPLLLKLPFRSAGESEWRGLEMARAAVEAGLDGITAEGILRVEDRRLSKRQVTLSGPPCLETTLEVVRELRAALGEGVPIRMSGGASDGPSVFRILEAGADSVLAFTAFVYQGPGLAARVNRQLLERMDEEGVRSAAEIRKRIALGMET